MIRLARHGAKKKPFYHIVAIDKRRARNAICTEKLGFYNPMEKHATINLERVKYWISTGAQCSETVAKLLSKYEQGQLHQTPKPVKKAKAKADAAKAKAQKPKIEAVKTSVEKPKAEKITNKTKAPEKAKTQGETKKEAPKVKAESPKEQEKTTDKKVAKKTSKKDEEKA